MWKFKTSRFKNAAPKPSKREEWIGEISAGNIASSCGNHVKASAAYMVFSIDAAGGSSIGLLPIGTKQRLNSPLPTIQAHSGFVTDFDFSAFDDFLLSTCSQDGTVKIWHLPAVDGAGDNICNPVCTLANEGRTVENVLWNPTVESILALSAQQSVKIYDVSQQTSVFDLSSHNDQVQSLSWKADGSLLASSSKDKMLRVFDVRSSSVAQSASGHQGVKDSRVLWLGDKDLVLSTGFSAMRQREIVLRDVRNFSSPVKTLPVDSSTGTLIPLFDADTGMIFIAGKGDTSVRYFELADKEPFLVENSVDRVEQVIKGAGLVSKRAVDVMSCEVDRLLVLTPNYVIPLSYCVPRKSYREFQSDLFPETFNGQPLLTAQQWLRGDETPAGKTVGLDPTKKKTLILRRPFGDENPEEFFSESNSQPVVESKPARCDPVANSQPAISATKKVADVPKAEPAASKVSSTSSASKTENVVVENRSTTETRPTATQNVSVAQVKKPGKVFTGVRQCKFRHVEGSTMHRSLHIDNVRNVSQSVPGESDGFCANPKFCAVPLSGPGGLVGIVQTDKPGRLPDTGIGAVQNGSTVTDFVWDPFDNRRLVVACDDAKIRIWNVPENGLDEVISEPSGYLKGHTEKIYFVRFHPLASGVLASASYDMTVRIWNVDTEEECIKLHGHTDAVFSLSWSLDGKRCATTCKDGKIRVYEPRLSTDPVLEGCGLEGSRGGRIVWACNDSVLIVTGFDRSSVRQIAVYDANDLGSALEKVDLDTSPAILVPFYDEDSSVLFVTGRGDSTVRTFEICAEAPYVSALSDFKAACLHQSLSFLPKHLVNVRNVEFARAMRLTSNSIEPVSFRVPRLRMEYFQDDLFSDTRVTWESVLASSEWLAGSDGSARLISLRPTDMPLLSEAPAEPVKKQKYESFDTYNAKYKTDDQKKEELLSALTNKLQLSDAPLPQDLTEGVDPDEWDD